MGAGGVGQTRSVHGVLTVEGTSRPALAEEVTASLRAQQFFWLDLDGVDDEAASLLGDTIGIHPLDVVAARRFEQRPKIVDGEDYTSMVLYGTTAGTAGPELVEAHLLVGTGFVVTIRRGPCPAFDDVRQRLADHRPRTFQSAQTEILYLITDRLIDSYLPVLEQFDNRIDDLEDAILVRPTEEQLGQLFDMKRSLIAIRRVVSPQRDMFASVSAGIVSIPGVDESDGRYLREIYDRLIRVSDLIDSYRDLLTSVMDTHLSTVSNRLNEVMKQLTIIATVFLPLSFLTGFFGQNFAVLVNAIRGRPAFWGLGIGLEVLCVYGLLYLFRRRGWLSQTD